MTAKVPASDRELDLSPQLALFELANRAVQVDTQGDDPLKVYNAYEELVTKLVDCARDSRQAAARAKAEGNETEFAALQLGALSVYQRKVRYPVHSEKLLKDINKGSSWLLMRGEWMKFGRTTPLFHSNVHPVLVAVR
jgi:hypothetical protein